MRRLFLSLIFLAAFCPTSKAATYYVCSTGNDSNNGTTTGTPWLHAPGMSTFTGSYTAAGGDQILLCGGGTWHFGNSGASPYFATWTFTSSGSSGTCQVNPANTVVTTGCIYIGTSASWYVPITGTVNTSGTTVTWVSGIRKPYACPTPGNSSNNLSNCAGDFGYLTSGETITINGTPYTIASTPAQGSTNQIILTTSAGTQTGVSFSYNYWTRPILNGDNPLSTSAVASCTYNQDSVHPFSVTGNYVIADDMEVMGWCWSGTSNGPMTSLTGTMNEQSNWFFHGWTTPTPSGSNNDSYAMTNCGAGLSGTPYCLRTLLVIDGSDSTGGTVFTDMGGSTGLTLGGGGEVSYSYINHVTNGVKDSPVFSFHDNMLANFFDPADGTTHGNVEEMAGGSSGSCYTLDTYLYDNILFDYAIGEQFDITPGCAASSKQGFVFNNVSDVPGVAGGNGFILEAGGSQASYTWNFFNNTTIYSMQMWSDAYSGGNVSTVTGQNNQFIGYTGQSQFLTTGHSGQGTLNYTSTAHEFYVSTATANSQGYTQSGDWAPTVSNCNGVSSSTCTVGAGSSVSSICSSMDNSAAATACAEGLPSTGPLTVNVSTDTVTPNALLVRGSTPDVGAYQFQAAATASQPAPFSMWRPF